MMMFLIMMMLMSTFFWSDVPVIPLISLLMSLMPPLISLLLPPQLFLIRIVPSPSITFRKKWPPSPSHDPHHFILVVDYDHDNDHLDILIVIKILMIMMMMTITSTQSQMQPLLEWGLSSSNLSKVNSIEDPVSTYNQWWCWWGRPFIYLDGWPNVIWVVFIYHHHHQGPPLDRRFCLCGLGSFSDDLETRFFHSPHQLKW